MAKSKWYLKPVGKPYRNSKGVLVQDFAINRFWYILTKIKHLIKGER